VASDPDARESPRALRVVRAAQLRARATRRAIGQILLGTIFLVGALANARAPDRGAHASVLWMTGLLVLSMLDVGLGLRTLARLRRRTARLWIAATAAWGLLSTLVVGFLLRG
jgi:heme/copper-type cytochrome/quinol oxidase subunit 3